MLVDLDETIIGSNVTAEDAWQAVCCDVSPLVGCAADELQSAIDAAATWFWSDHERGHRGRIDLAAATRQIVEVALTDLQVESLDLASRIAASFRALRDEYVLLPGAHEALAALRARGVRLALITNGAGSVQRGKIERFELARHFEHVFIEGELRFGKPDERVYRHAVETLGCDVSDTWIVGDNLVWEVAVPQRLGLYAIWLDRMGRGLPADSPIVPDRIISSLGELVS